MMILALFCGLTAIAAALEFAARLLRRPLSVPTRRRR